MPRRTAIPPQAEAAPPKNRMGGWLPSLGVAAGIFGGIFVVSGAGADTLGQLAATGPEPVRNIAVQLGGDPHRSGKAEAVIATARTMQGTSAEIGVTGRTFITGAELTRRCYKAAGISLPASIDGQARYGRPVNGLANAKRGDLLVWSDPSRVAIYLGKGRMIQAPGGGKPVREVDATKYGKPTAVRRLV